MGPRAARTAVLLLPLALAGCSGSAEEDAAHAREQSAQRGSWVPAESPDAPPVPSGPEPAPLAAPAGSTHAPSPAGAETEAAPDPRYPLHGVTFHFLARVYAQADAGSEVVGYMRRGARFRAAPGVAGPGCEGGWHEVPGGGYVCRGEGFLIGDEPQRFEPSPLPPALDDPLPYTYAWVAREQVPQYWRMPSADEEQAAAEAIAALRAFEQAHAEASAADAGVADGGVTGTGFDSDGVQAADAGAGEPEDGPALPDYVRIAMRKGFYVSVDREESDGSRRFLRTVRGGYLPRDPLAFAEAPEMKGVALGGSTHLPVAFVHRGGARRLRRDPSSGALRNDGHLERLDSFVVAEELDRRGRPYLMAREGWLVSASAARVARPASRPEDVARDERWIHVDLSEQTLIAYEGDVPVYATIVSTGKEGYETPTGLWRIESKHVSNTMDDLSSPEGAYLIEDVPWTMFFEGSYALHGAFWHSRFGHVRSHGCVNLAPADAHWLFQWAGPSLPPAWHGVLTNGGRKGSWIHIVE